MLFGSLVVLTALALLVILLFPFRVRIRYRRNEDGGHEIAVMIRFRGAVHAGWEITVFRYSSEQKRTASGESNESKLEEEQQADHHLESSPVHTLLNGVNTLQTLFDGGGNEAQSQSLLKTLQYRVDTPMRFLQYVRDCEALIWETRFGTGDAASTAVLYGVIWGVKATVYSTLTRWVHFRSVPHFLVVPDYDKATLAVVFDGIFRFRLGQIIVMETLAMLRKWKKGVGRIGVRQETSY